jgi:hypothetical protein
MVTAFKTLKHFEGALSFPLFEFTTVISSIPAIYQGFILVILFVISKTLP